MYHFACFTFDFFIIFHSLIEFEVSNNNSKNNRKHVTSYIHEDSRESSFYDTSIHTSNNVDCPHSDVDNNDKL